MPKFTNVCKNPLHEEWNENNDDSKCIHLRAYGLSEVLNVYKRLKIDHCGDQSRYISHSCCYCLSVCLKKEEFTRHLSSDLQISLKEKINNILKKHGLDQADSPELTSDNEMEWESSEISTQGFSQENDSTTLTLSSPSQQLILSQETDSLIPSAETKDNACQTESSMSNSVLIDKVEYEELIFKASRSFNLQKEVTKVKEKCFALYGDEGSPEMDPSKFEKICQDAEAPNIFPYIYNALSVERMSENRLMLNKIRTMVIIYVMIFGQSQKSNWFQVALSRTLSQYGISECGLTALRNLGIAAHPRTTKKATASVASNHLQQVQSFFQEATDKGHFIVMFIDDYHNIHTKHRPNEKQRSESVHMATLMVKVFEKIKAVPQEGNESPLSENPADINILHQMINQNMSTLSKSYAQEMPDWCNLPNVSECPVCKDALKNKIDLLAKRANSAVFRPHDVDEAGDDEVIADDDVSDFKGEPENRPSDDFDDVEMDDTHYTDRALSALVTAICLVLISGVYDLRPLVNTYVNDALNMNTEEALMLSPMCSVDQMEFNSSCKIMSLVGQYESPEFHRQSKEFAEALRNAGYKVKHDSMENTDHFSIVHNFTLPSYNLTKVIVDFINDVSQICW
eukprot:gene10439-19142_t